MTNRALRVGLTALWLAAFAMTASAQLNPTVTVLSSPAAPVPAECDQSVAPQAAPRIQVAEIPEPPKRNANAAPPTASVRVQLKDVQNAADQGVRDTFRDALARVKATLAAYPAGGERVAAADVIRVYDDLDRIWTYQMDSRTGAFFDATTVPGQIMRGYPDYERAIADQVLVDARGTRFYPTPETRDFVVREAAQRLKQLGVTVTTRAPRPARVLPRLAATGPKPAGREAKPAERKEAKAPTANAERKPPAHRTARKHRPTSKVARAPENPPAKQTPATHPSETVGATPEQAQPSKQAQPKSAPVSVPPPAVKPAVAPPTEKAKAAVTTTTAIPSPALTPAPSTPPAASETTSASSSAPVSTTSTATTATTATTTATTVATATETTASAPATAAAVSAAADTTGTTAKGQPQSKGVILPIILIVVGIGVLIVLFRASS